MKNGNFPVPTGVGHVVIGDNALPIVTTDHSEDIGAAHVGYFTGT